MSIVSDKIEIETVTTKRLPDELQWYGYGLNVQPKNGHGSDLIAEGSDCDDTLFGLSADKFTDEELQRLADVAGRMLADRVKHVPVSKVVSFWWNWVNLHNTANCGDRTHVITFTTIDGKPGCDSIKMEELNND